MKAKSPQGPLSSRERVIRALEPSAGGSCPRRSGRDELFRRPTSAWWPSCARRWSWTSRGAGQGGRAVPDARRDRPRTCDRRSASTWSTCPTSRTCSAMRTPAGSPGGPSTARTCSSRPSSTPTPEPNGDILMYPQGDRSAKPSARMPKGGYYFDSIIRQKPIDEAKLNPADNLEEFGPISEEALRHYEQRANDLYNNTDLAIGAGFPGTAFGDIALVPGPWMKDPKGIRDIEEWYISTVTRQEYIREVFARQAEIAIENLKRIHQAVGDKVHVVFMDGTDLASQNSLFCSPDTYRELYPALQQEGQRLGPRPHEVEDAEALLRRVRAADRGLHRRRLRRAEPRADLRPQDGPAAPGRYVRRPHRLLGRRRRYPADPAVRHARRGPGPGRRAGENLRPQGRLRLQHHPQHPVQHARRRTCWRCSRLWDARCRKYDQCKNNKGGTSPPS